MKRFATAAENTDADNTITIEDLINIDHVEGSVSMGGIASSADVPGNNIVFLGDSIAQGYSGVSNVANRYGTVLCAMLGFTEVNNSLHGNTIENRSPAGISGGDAISDPTVLPQIPVYGSSYAYLIIEGGINDVDANTTNPGTYNLANFNTDYTTILNYAITTRGWPAGRIILLSTFLRDNPPTLTYQLSINSAIQTLATTFGTQFFDIYTAMVNSGGLYLSQVAQAGYTGNNGTHPNDMGHKLAALGLARIIINAVYKNSQKLAVNGTVEFIKMVYRNFSVLNDNDGNYFIGIDKNGNVGIVPALPNDTKYNGIMNIMGTMIQDGSVIPAGANPQDIILRGTWIGVGTPSRILSGYNTAIFNAIELSDDGNNANFRMHYSGSQWAFYNDSGNGAGTLLAAVFRNGMMLTQGDDGVIAPPSGVPSQQGDIWVGRGNSLGAVIGPHEPAFGAFLPANGFGNTEITNGFSTGNISFYTSGGTDGGRVQAWQMNAGGDLESVVTGDGIIMKSPDGTRYKVTVANGGTLAVAPA